MLKSVVIETKADIEWQTGSAGSVETHRGLRRDMTEFFAKGDLTDRLIPPQGGPCSCAQTEFLNNIGHEPSSASHRKRRFHPRGQTLRKPHEWAFLSAAKIFACGPGGESVRHAQEGPVELLRQAQFATLDLMRRAQGHALGAIGFGPTELTHRRLATGDHWRLRDYGGSSPQASLLIIAAPIKRPYIWDLGPNVSAIRYCLNCGVRVYLLEWIAPTASGGHVGLDECVRAISECAARIATEPRATKPFLIGHSLGGTLAAAFSACEPRAVRGLLLLNAPLCFQPATNRFRDALVSMIPPDLSEADIIPGSLLSHASAFASPATFVWYRLMDAMASIGDLRALDVHARVERWALDEVTLPGKLVHQIAEWLYRENRFCRGALTVLGRTIGPSCLDIPTLAVVNTADEIVPLASIEPLLDALPTKDVTLIKYPGEVGIALQHLGILVGREAYARIWPQIIAWLAAHR
jgi:polyhydroxyalkanoate synthase